MTTDAVNEIESPAEPEKAWWENGENGGGVARESVPERIGGDAPPPPEPPEFEVIEDDVLSETGGSFAICEICGSIVSNDEMDLKKHLASHQPTRTPSPSSAITRTGDDLAALVRGAMKSALKERKLTQAEFCRQVDVSQKHMSQMMSGAANGSMELWSKYATQLGLQWSVTLKPHEP